MDNLFTDLISSLWHLLRPVLAAGSPLFIGIIIAWLLNPAVDRLTSKLGTGRAILATYVLLFAALAAFAASFTVLILGSLPTEGIEATLLLILDYFRQAYDSAASFLSRWFSSDFADSSRAAEKLLLWVRQRFTIRTLASDLRSFTGTMVSIFLGIVASIFLFQDFQ